MSHRFVRGLRSETARALVLCGCSIFGVGSGIAVAQDAGTLREPEDVVGWADAIRTLLAHRDAAQQRASSDRLRAQERFRWSRAAEALEALYARVGA